MRKPVDLTTTEKGVARGARVLLGEIEKGGLVAVSFKKQDNTLRTLCGVLVEVKGKDDKEVVVIQTHEGYRSANLHRVINVKALS